MSLNNWTASDNTNAFGPDDSILGHEAAVATIDLKSWLSGDSKRQKDLKAAGKRKITLMQEPRASELSICPL